MPFFPFSTEKDEQKKSLIKQESKEIKNSSVSGPIIKCPRKKKDVLCDNLTKHVSASGEYLCAVHKDLIDSEICNFITSGGRCLSQILETCYCNNYPKKCQCLEANNLGILDPNALPLICHCPENIKLCREHMIVHQSSSFHENNLKISEYWKGYQNWVKMDNPRKIVTEIIKKEKGYFRDTVYFIEKDNFKYNFEYMEKYLTSVGVFILECPDHYCLSIKC